MFTFFFLKDGSYEISFTAVCSVICFCCYSFGSCLGAAAVVCVRAMQVYRVKDNVTYSVVIEEYDTERGGWKPYTAEDVQVL